MSFGLMSFAECHYAECHYAECHYAECHYAECRGALFFFIFSHRGVILNPLSQDCESSALPLYYHNFPSSKKMLEILTIDSEPKSTEPRGPGDPSFKLNMQQ